MGRWSVVLAFLLSLVFSDLAAQSDKATTLKLKEDPAVESGRVAIVSGVVGAKEDRYVLADLSILQPVAVTLLSPAAEPSLKIRLHSSRWGNISREGSLNGDTRRTFKFRTQGQVGISIRSPNEHEQEYDLVAWVGSEIGPEFVVENAIVSPDRYEQYVAANPEAYPEDTPGTEDEGPSLVMIVIAALLFGIFVLLTFIAVRMVRS